MKSLHLIRVRYLGPTDTKPTHVQLQSGHFGDTVTLSAAGFDLVASAVNWLEAAGFDLVAFADMGALRSGDVVILSGTFRPLRGWARPRGVAP